MQNYDVASWQRGWWSEAVGHSRRHLAGHSICQVIQIWARSRREATQGDRGPHGTRRTLNGRTLRRRQPGISPCSAWSRARRSLETSKQREGTTKNAPATERRKFEPDRAAEEQRDRLHHGILCSSTGFALDSATSGVAGWGNRTIFADHAHFAFRSEEESKSPGRSDSEFAQGTRRRVLQYDRRCCSLLMRGLTRAAECQVRPPRSRCKADS